MLVLKKPFHEKGAEVLLKGKPAIITSLHESKIGNEVYVHSMQAKWGEHKKPGTCSAMDIEPINAQA
jgi:hypothetical protein